MNKRFFRKHFISAETAIVASILLLVETGLALFLYTMGMAGRMYVDSCTFAQTSLSAMLPVLTFAIILTQTIGGSRDYYAGVVYPLVEAAGGRRNLAVMQVVSSTTRWMLVFAAMIVCVAAGSFAFRGSGPLKVEDINIGYVEQVIRILVTGFSCLAVVWGSTAAGYLASRIASGSTWVSVISGCAYWAALSLTDGFGTFSAIHAPLSVGRWNEIIPAVLPATLIQMALGTLFAVAAIRLFQHRDLVWKANAK